MSPAVKPSSGNSCMVNDTMKVDLDSDRRLLFCRTLVSCGVELARLTSSSRILKSVAANFETSRSAQLLHAEVVVELDVSQSQYLTLTNSNSFPHSTFNWVGLDGSQVLTHMTPVNNYNSQCNIDDIRRGVTGHKNLEVTGEDIRESGT